MGIIREELHDVRLFSNVVAFSVLFLERFPTTCKQDSACILYERFDTR